MVDEKINEYQISEGREDFLCIKAVEEITTERNSTIFLSVVFLHVQKKTNQIKSGNKRKLKKKVS